MVVQINAAAKISPEERNTYQVWYARRMPGRAEYVSGRFLATQTLEHTHVHVADVVAGDRGQVLAAMQGEKSTTPRLKAGACEARGASPELTSLSQEV